MIYFVKSQVLQQREQVTAAETVDQRLESDRAISR